MKLIKIFFKNHCQLLPEYLSALLLLARRGGQWLNWHEETPLSSVQLSPVPSHLCRKVVCQTECSSDIGVEASCPQSCPCLRTDWLTDSIRVSCSQLTCQGERENFLTPSPLSLSLSSISPLCLSRCYDSTEIELPWWEISGRRREHTLNGCFNVQRHRLYWHFSATSRITPLVKIYISNRLEMCGDSAVQFSVGCTQHILIFIDLTWWQDGWRVRSDADLFWFETWRKVS